ncbi:MAG: hypothetical protein JW384_01851 [Nitrosomonadaceae bacterium]|nr:hypothetical protein [Nitrosomonadaceae bacterium]
MSTLLSRDLTGNGVIVYFQDVPVAAVDSLQEHINSEYRHRSWTILMSADAGCLMAVSDESTDGVLHFVNGCWASLTPAEVASRRN